MSLVWGSWSVQLKVLMKLLKITLPSVVVLELKAIYGMGVETHVVMLNAFKCVNGQKLMSKHLKLNYNSSYTRSWFSGFSRFI